MALFLKCRNLILPLVQCLENSFYVIQTTSVEPFKLNQLQQLKLRRLLNWLLQQSKSLREDEGFDLFWAKLLKFTELMDIPDPQLLRQSKRPARLEDGNSSGHYHDSPKDLYRQLYYEV